MKLRAIKMSPDYIFYSTGCMTYSIVTEDDIEVGRLLDYSNAGYPVSKPFIARFTVQARYNLNTPLADIEGTSREKVLGTFRKSMENHMRRVQGAIDYYRNYLSELEEVRYIEYVPLDNAVIKAKLYLIGAPMIYVDLSQGELAKAILDTNITIHDVYILPRDNGRETRCRFQYNHTTNICALCHLDSDHVFIEVDLDERKD